MSLDTGGEVFFDAVAGACRFAEDIHGGMLEQLVYLIEFSVVQKVGVGREQPSDGAFSVEACDDISGIGHDSSFKFCGPEGSAGLEVSGGSKMSPRPASKEKAAERQGEGFRYPR